MLRQIASLLLLSGSFSLLPVATPAAADRLDDQIGRLRDIGKHGKGHQAAIAAWRELVRSDATALPRILAAIDEGHPLAANWLRSAVETIVARAADELPWSILDAYFLDRTQPPRARRMVYEILLTHDPSVADRWLPTSLDDPSLEMRRDAVARQLRLAEQTRQHDTDPWQKTRTEYRIALTAARDLDQVTEATDVLRELGEEVDLVRHFGFLTNWQLIGPFDNRDRAGFDRVYGPEEDDATFDPSFPDRSYQRDGEAVTWIDYASDDSHGKIDLNEPLGKVKEVVGYARALYMSPSERPAEIRVTSANAVKVWFRGKQVMDHPIYHAGTELDQYRVRITVPAGPSVLLVKVCQNEQTETWTEPWGFQLRICDKEGTAIVASAAEPQPESETGAAARPAAGLRGQAGVR